MPKSQYRYAFRSSAATGCGWIATYNVLEILGKNPNAESIIYSFEHEFPLVNGNMGTFLMTPAYYLRKLGYTVNFTTKRNKIDQLASKSNVGILFFWWKHKCKVGAHFVAVEKTEKGYVGYNTFSNSQGPDNYGESIENFLDKHKYFGAVYFSIQ